MEIIDKIISILIVGILAWIVGRIFPSKGEQGPIGPVGPVGPAGPKGTCECDLTEIRLLHEQARTLMEKLEMQNKAIGAIKNSAGSKFGDTMEALKSSSNCKVAAEPGWYNAGNCYQYRKSGTQQDWYESRGACLRLGGDLAHLGIRDLNIRSSIINATLGNDIAWIGASDHRDEGNFVWIDKTPAYGESLGWDEGEPNNLGGNEDCVVVNRPTTPHNTANDGTCLSIFYALCEKKLVTL